MLQFVHFTFTTSNFSRFKNLDKKIITIDLHLDLHSSTLVKSWHFPSFSTCLRDHKYINTANRSSVPPRYMDTISLNMQLQIVNRCVYVCVRPPKQHYHPHTKLNQTEIAMQITKANLIKQTAIVMLIRPIGLNVPTELHSTWIINVLE